MRQKTNIRRNTLAFGIPMVRRDHKNERFGGKTKTKPKTFTLLYLCVWVQLSEQENYDRQSAKRPVQHSEEIPVPVLKTIGVQSAQMSPMMNHMLKLHSVVIMKALYWIGSSPQTFNQTDLDEPGRDLDLQKVSTELLASRINE